MFYVPVFLTRTFAAEGWVALSAFALQLVRLASEVQSCILMLHGGNVVAICQQGLTQTNLPILDVCLVVLPAARPQVQHISQSHPAGTPLKSTLWYTTIARLQECMTD